MENSANSSKDLNYRMNKKLLFLLGFFVFLVFIFLSYLVHKDLFTQIDFDTTVKLQDNISRRFDTSFSLFSLFGSFEILTFFLILVILINRKIKSIFVIFLYILTLFLELFGKLFVDHPGPPYLFFRYDIPFNFPSSYVSPGSSYPSGHSTRTAFVSAILLFLILRSKKLSKVQKITISGLVLLFDITMFASRIYLGEHWISDVIGGGLLGYSLGLLSLAFL